MKKLVVLSAFVFALTGCASIFSGQSQNVTLSSPDTDVTVKIYNRDGMQVASGVAPNTFNLKRGAGFFRSEEYKLVVSKPGYEDQTITTLSRLNGFYLANIIFGGVVGMLVIDPATGAMWEFDNITIPKLTPIKLEVNQ